MTDTTTHVHASDTAYDGTCKDCVHEADPLNEPMTQYAAYPLTLAHLLAQLTYKDHWRFTLANVDRGQGSGGLTLSILITTPDSYGHGMRNVVHYFPVPPAAYDMRSWRRWLFEQILLVETHEAMEFFTIGIDKPYAPSHGPGSDPYMIREIGTDVDQRTSYRGELTT